tara:strand:+ start:5194 stop:5616 length:423 start_codon:yes stop_codon:yes gene_type:complete
MQQVALEKAIKNDQWITGLEEDIADPSPLPNMPGYTILIRPTSVKSKTKGGILLPDSTVEDISYLTTVGKVLSVGDSAYKDKERFPNGSWCKTGDYVCYGKHTGTKIIYKGIKLLLVYDDQIMMRVDSPKDLDPTFNLSH